MDSATLRKRLTQNLLDEINDVQFPSVTMMNRLEARLAADDLADYAEALSKKIEATHYPSISMLDRLDRVLDRLEQVERSRQLAAARSEGPRET
jgi:hypothetical protein